MTPDRVWSSNELRYTVSNTLFLDTLDMLRSGNGAAKDELAGDSIEAPHPLPAANGHMLNREERARLVRQALGTDDQDHEDMLGRVKARFDRSCTRPPLAI